MLKRRKRSERDLRRRGMTLAEVIVSTLLVGLLMTGALVSVGASARSASTAADARDAAALARQLLDEIAALPYEDANQTASYGLESGETAAPGARTHCDDLDDYINWIDSPPKDRGGAAIPGFTGWQRTADVVKVHDVDYSQRSDGSSDKGYRLVTVTVISPTGKTATLRVYRTKDAGSLQAQGVGQSLVTWVGASLQSGGGKPVVGGAHLLNHAGDQ